MTGPATEVAAQGADAAAKTPWTNDAIMQASRELETLSKIGTKDKEILKRLTRMIIWAKAAIQEFFVSRDTLTNTWAERDEANEIRVQDVTDAQGNKGHAPVYKNAVEHQLRLNELLRGPATYTTEPPAPFTWANLKEFQRFPDASVIANLGPFVKLDDER